jgi:hypothetical protein
MHIPHVIVFLFPFVANASLSLSSATEVVKAIESSANRDMSDSEAGIYNWSPFSATKYSDTDLAIEAYRRPRLRGIGGLVKGRFCLPFALHKPDLSANSIFPSWNIALASLEYVPHGTGE